MNPVSVSLKISIISVSLSRAIFTVCRHLDWPLFSFSTLRILSHWFLMLLKRHTSEDNVVLSYYFLNFVCNMSRFIFLLFLFEICWPRIYGLMSFINFRKFSFSLLFLGCHQTSVCISITLILFSTVVSTIVTVKVNFVYQLYWAKGCLDSW